MAFDKIIEAIENMTDTEAKKTFGALSCDFFNPISRAHSGVLGRSLVLFIWCAQVVVCIPS